MIDLINTKNKPYTIFNRKYRTDARFLGQSGRVTSIRDHSYKYIYYHDDKKEEFYDVKTFCIDEKNILKTKNKSVETKLSEFREFFNNSEKKGLQNQIDYFIYSLTNNKSSKKIVKNFFTFNILHYEKKDIVNYLNNKIKKYYNCKYNIQNQKSDLLIILYSSEDENLNKVYSDISNYSYKKLLWIDCNMSVSIRTNQIKRYLKTLYFNRKFFIQEPSLIFYELKKIVNAISRNYLLKKLKRIK